MHYKMSEIVAFLRNLLAREWPPEEASGRFLGAMAERFPNAKAEDVERALIVLTHESEFEAEEAQRQQDELERMIKLTEHHKISENTPWSEAVRIAAGRGDSEAVTYLAELESVGNKVSIALMHAAVERHPSWDCIEFGRYVCLDDDGPQGTPKSLIDWFQMTFRGEAHAVEERALASGEVRNV
jgi:hypothetical protein